MRKRRCIYYLDFNSLKTNLLTLKLTYNLSDEFNEPIIHRFNYVCVELAYIGSIGAGGVYRKFL